MSPKEKGKFAYLSFEECWKDYRTLCTYKDSEKEIYKNFFEHGVSFAEKRLLERVGKCEGCRNEDTCKASNIVPCHVFKFKWTPKETK